MKSLRYWENAARQSLERSRTRRALREHHSRERAALRGLVAIVLLLLILDAVLNLTGALK